MSIKIILIVAVVAFAFADHHATSYASVNSHVAPHHEHVHHEEHYPHHYPKYEYKYGVEDYHTGDKKSHSEHRDGDVVKGEYSITQPDGRIRTVHYTSDKHTDFNAHVIYSGHASHPRYYHLTF